MLKEILSHKNLPVDLYRFKNGYIFKSSRSIFFIGEERQELFSLDENFTIESVASNIVIRTKNDLRFYNYDFELKYRYEFNSTGSRQVEDAIDNKIILGELIEDSYFLSIISNDNGLFWRSTFPQVQHCRFVNESKFLYTEDKSAVCYDFMNDKEVWKINLEKRWQNERVNSINVFGGSVVLLLNNDVLIGLDAKTGGINWEKVMPTRILSPAAFSEGKIYWSALGKNPVYQVIDMITGDIDINRIPGTDLVDRLTFTRPFIFKNWLLLTSVSSHEILVMDKQTLALVFIEKIEGCKNRIPIDNSPQVVDDLVYQLDGDNTLHLYKLSELPSENP